jgi:hypothetical protein
MCATSCAVKSCRSQFFGISCRRSPAFMNVRDATVWAQCALESTTYAGLQSWTLRGWTRSTTRHPLTFRLGSRRSRRGSTCIAVLCAVRASARSAGNTSTTHRGGPVVVDAGLHDRRVDSNADSNPIDDQSVHQDHHAQLPPNRNHGGPSRTLRMDLRIRWSTPLTLGAQVHGQVD